MKCLSHLDMMRTFARAMRRGGIPISYTTGFNPHARIVFGLPLQVGVTSDAEYFDICVEGERESGMHEGADLGALIAKLNACLPDGLAVNAARERVAKENIMSIITHAGYEMRVRRKQDDNGNHSDISAALGRAVAGFLLPGPKIVAKDAGVRQNRKTHRDNGAAREMDLAPLVRSLTVRGDILAMTVTAGSVNNVKPDLVLGAINTIHKKNTRGFESGWEFSRVSLHRKALYVELGGVLLKPIDREICGFSESA